jgi:glutaredoxin
MARAELTRLSLPFHNIDIFAFEPDKGSVEEERILLAWNGKVPQIFINDEHIGGMRSGLYIYVCRPSVSP